MKRILILFTLSLLFLSLSACNEENTLAETELSEREQVLISSVSDQSFVFDFQTGEEYKQITIWVDKYEFGELVDEKISEMTTDIEHNGTIIFTNSPIPDERIETIFTIIVSSDKGSSSSRVVQKLKSTEQSTWGSNPMENIPLEETATLASISYANGHGRSSLSSDFYTDLDKHLNEIKEYDVVYVLKSKFHK
ncbi:hypothetical protein MHH81_06650 [Psychrobacillus sp. FSL H8-0484]|uniref:hypothetical protein n=1 Tax=Psychrobacillus sp. FSL H8-0484 TaxID=2921390 RepID=UPI0030FA5721